MKTNIERHLILEGNSPYIRKAWMNKGETFSQFLFLDPRREQVRFWIEDLNDFEEFDRGILVVFLPDSKIKEISGHLPYLRSLKFNRIWLHYRNSFRLNEIPIMWNSKKLSIPPKLDITFLEKQVGYPVPFSQNLDLPWSESVSLIASLSKSPDITDCLDTIEYAYDEALNAISNFQKQVFIDAINPIIQMRSKYDKMSMNNFVSLLLDQIDYLNSDELIVPLFRTKKMSDIINEIRLLADEAQTKIQNNTMIRIESELDLLRKEIFS